MPQQPKTDELAKREDSIYIAASNYGRLLAPDDSVLSARGQSYTIYRETLRDSQCVSTFSQRRLAVVSREWQVDPASESAIDVAAADSLRENLQTIDFDRITDLMLYARWYGHAIGECMWERREGRIWLADVKVRDRARFAYDVDDRIYLHRIRGTFEEMPDRKFWRVATGADHDDSPYGLGLAHYAYWPVYFKRAGIKFWLVFCEKFGSPTATAKVPRGMIDDPETRARCLEALGAIATETAVLIPEGMEVELLEAARSGGGTYEDLVNSLDNSLAKIIIGQTASSEGTPGRLGNDDLQGDVRIDLIKADADLICSSFNRQVAAWLTEWNHPGARPPRVWRVVEPPEDLTARAERDTKIHALGYEPTEEYIVETYGPGWKKQAVKAGIDPNAVPGQLAQEFAELGNLAAIKLAHRGDQTALVLAAERFASRYEEIVGDRVRGLLDLAEQTGDYETFARHLKAMMAEPPKDDTAGALTRAGIFSRFLGAFRAQR